MRMGNGEWCGVVCVVGLNMYRRVSVENWLSAVIANDKQRAEMKLWPYDLSESIRNINCLIQEA